jgi:autotransporter adhesin
MRIHKHYAGLTLLELMLAVAGTALVSAAIAAMTSAVTHGTDSRTDLRTLLVRQKTITARLTAAIRSSTKVLAANDDGIVLWINDENASGTPNLSEIQRIVRDAGSKEMLSFTAPDSLLPASDTSYDLTTTDFEAVTAAPEDTADFPSETWATNIDAWQIDLNHADAKQASLVSNRLTLTTGTLGTPGTLRDITIAAAALRNR